MKMQTLGNKPQQLRKLFFNTDTVAIKAGAPVVLNASATTKLGFGAKSIESLAAAEQGFFFGLAGQETAVGAYGESVFGYVQYSRTVLRSRAASTDTWASVAAGALGDVYSLVTAAGVQGISRSAAGSAITNPQIIKSLEALASIASAASSVTAGVADAGLLYSTGFVKTFVSIM
jgi:hypothetical protein